MMNEKRSGWIDGEENRADWTLTRAGLGLALPLHRASDLCRAKPQAAAKLQNLRVLLRSVN